MRDIGKFPPSNIGRLLLLKSYRAAEHMRPPGRCIQWRSSRQRGRDGPSPRTHLKRSYIRRKRSLNAPWQSSHRQTEDRKSTRLNSSHVAISYAVFCLKKKKHKYIRTKCCFIRHTKE